jgi:hypothetical protein
VRLLRFVVLLCVVDSFCLCYYWLGVLRVCCCVLVLCGVRVLFVLFAFYVCVFPRSLCWFVLVCVFVVV